MVENEKPASPPEDDPLLKDLMPRERQLVLAVVAQHLELTIEEALEAPRAAGM
jgi:hypothetical protein